MLPSFVLIVDYQIVEALIKINQDSVNAIHDEMTKQEKKTEITTEIDCIQDEIKKRLDRVRELQNQVARRESISFVETIKKDLLALDREIILKCKILSCIRFY